MASARTRYTARKGRPGKTNSRVSALRPGRPRCGNAASFLCLRECEPPPCGRLPAHHAPRCNRKCLSGRGPRVPSIGYASAGIPAVNQLADVLMFDEFAPIGSGQAFLHFAQKPFIVIHKALYGLLRKRLRVAAMLSSKAAELSLQFGGKVQFHCAFRVEVMPASVNGHERLCMLGSVPNGADKPQWLHIVPNSEIKSQDNHSVHSVHRLISAIIIG